MDRQQIEPQMHELKSVVTNLIAASLAGLCCGIALAVLAVIGQSILLLL
jgi:hypothetical protein